MAPFVTIDASPDFGPTAAPASKTVAAASSKRSLLIAPPSLSSNEAALASTLASVDRATTDLQMLDRLAARAVALPSATYDLVLILAAADGSHAETFSLLDRAVVEVVAESLRPGGHFQAQHGVPLDGNAQVRKEAVLAGLVAKDGGFTKVEEEVVVLRFGKNKANGVGKPTAAAIVPSRVPMVDPNDDDFDMDAEDEEDPELVDPNTLLSAADNKRPITVPAECAPRVGKRRRACANCDCGLAEVLAAEEAARRADADAQIKTMAQKSVKLELDDLTEVDFTVEGKKGSCNNCSLGDAFRCDGCPYKGFAPWDAKVGEEVRLLNNDVDL